MRITNKEKYENICIFKNMVTFGMPNFSTNGAVVVISVVLRSIVVITSILVVTSVLVITGVLVLTIVAVSISVNVVIVRSRLLWVDIGNIAVVGGIDIIVVDAVIAGGIVIKLVQ